MFLEVLAYFLNLVRYLSLFEILRKLLTIENKVIGKMVDMFQLFDINITNVRVLQPLFLNVCLIKVFKFVKEVQKEVCLLVKNDLKLFFEWIK